MVELEDDLVLVVLRSAGTDDIRAEITGEPLRGGEDAGDPILELLLAPLLYSPGSDCRNGWIFLIRIILTLD